MQYIYNGIHFSELRKSDLVGMPLADLIKIRDENNDIHIGEMEDRELWGYAGGIRRSDMDLFPPGFEDLKFDIGCMLDETTDSETCGSCSTPELDAAWQRWKTRDPSVSCGEALRVPDVVLGFIEKAVDSREDYFLAKSSRRTLARYQNYTDQADETREREITKIANEAASSFGGARSLGELRAIINLAQIRRASQFDQTSSSAMSIAISKMRQAEYHIEAILREKHKPTLEQEAIMNSWYKAKFGGVEPSVEHLMNFDPLP
jgi:hypothetical protein